jgi:hypothetical protein
MVRVCAWAVMALSLLSRAASDALPADTARSPPTAVSSGSSCSDSPNVVRNGGFESGSIKPWIEFLRPVPGQANSTLKIVEGGYKSSHALRMEVGYVAQIKQKDIPTCESTIYTVSFAYKVLNATATCIIRTTANSSTSNVYQSIVSPLLPGDWTTDRLKFHSELAVPYDLRIALVCQYEDSSATILLDDIQVKATGSVAAKGCPKPVSIPNGGFDHGQIGPWSAVGNENPPQLAIVSPGYKSPYALELDYAESNFTMSYAEILFNGTCEGYEYNVSFALNWVNYTGPASNRNTGCSLGVSVNPCVPTESDVNVYVASSTPGWKEHSYVCLADTNNEGSIFVEMSCSTKNHTLIPAFAVQVDNFSFRLLPTPYSSPSKTAARPTAAANPHGREEPREV